MKLKVTWGEEKYSPVQFQSYGVGPFSVEIDVPEGMDPAPVARAALAKLEAIAVEEFERKTKDYLGRMIRSGQLAADARTCK